jgi:hypothetical protein
MTHLAGLFEGIFRQTAWITNDMDGALDLFARDYGITEWLQFRNFNMQTGPDRFADTHFSLAKRGGIELELIQPLGGADEVYVQALQGKPNGLKVCFHHICYLQQTREALERLRAAAQARGREIVLSGLTDSGTTYFYTDDRATLGHHIEYIYYPEADYTHLEAIIPVN